VSTQAIVEPRRERAGAPPPARPAATRRRGPARSLRGAWPGYLLLAPAFALFLVVMLIPIGKAVQISFYHWNPIPGADSPWAGLDNYSRAFADPKFRLGLLNATVYMLVTVPGQIVLGLGLALLLERALPARTLFRVLFYLPVVTSWVVVSLLFRYLFATDGGLVNWVLVDGLHVVREPVGWLDARWTGIAALCALGVWKGVGWTAVMLMAGLSGVPAELHEAAAVDGAGYGRRVWHVTLPALRRTLLFVTVLLVIGSFQAFISVLLMTAGGPAGETEMPLTYLYKQAFSYIDFGYGSALAVLMTLLVLLLSAGQAAAAAWVERGER
jgi:multiple sugar transport system permease protein